jgi:hypothetical protein
MDETNNWIFAIQLDMLVKNKLVGTNLNLMLKYVNGQINSQLESDWVEKSNMDLDEKIKNIVEIYIKFILDDFNFLNSHPEKYTIENYLKDENLIYLIKKYIGMY